VTVAGMAIAELDLSNRPARGVELAENYHRTRRSASRRPARALIAASPDLNGRRRGIEVGLKPPIAVVS
jgi:hypothetical protein